MNRRRFGWTGSEVPVIGQGTWKMEGDGPVEALAALPDRQANVIRRQYLREIDVHAVRKERVVLDLGTQLVHIDPAAQRKRDFERLLANRHFLQFGVVFLAPFDDERVFSWK